MTTPPHSMTWTTHLAARRPGRALLALIIITLALCAIAALGAGWPLIVLAAVLLVGSIAEFLFPVTYTLDAHGAHARYLGTHRLLPWTRVRRVYLQPTGVKLSPLAAPTWAEAYRGVMLRTSERDAVLAAVRAWTANATARPEIVMDASTREGRGA